MQYSINSDKVVIRRGSLPLAIVLVAGGALLALLLWDIRPFSTTGHYVGRNNPFLFSILLIIYGLVTLVRAFQVVVIDKDGIRGGGMGQLKWAEVRQIKMEQQKCFTLFGTIFSNYDPCWGICIKSVNGETFLKFPEDRPHMDLVQAINGIAPFEVAIDTEALSEYRKSVKTYEQNKSAAKEKAAEEKKPVDNSFTTPVIIGIVLMLLLVGLIVWRLTQI